MIDRITTPLLVAGLLMAAPALAEQPPSAGGEELTILFTGSVVGRLEPGG